MSAAAAVILVAGSVLGGLAPGGAVAEVAGRDPVQCDFDGDGYADLAVGVPGEDVQGKRDAGAVQVMYGSASGLTARDQLWHQGRKGVKGALERGDRWGDALACGDFDGDGYADLAVGSPAENVGRVVDAGAVQVLYGGRRGLTARDQVWHQGKPGVPGSNERGDGFGGSLAAGDFDGDGYVDLAIGSPWEDVGSVSDAGRVTVLRGAHRGLTSSGSQSWRQGSGGVASQPGRWEAFGRELAAADVNGDGSDDLAIRVGWETDIPETGEYFSAAHLLLGTPEGLTGVGSQYIVPTSLVESRSMFSFSLTFGDFNRDGRADLALASADGIVAVLHGRPHGLEVAPLPETSTPGLDAWWPVRTGEEGIGLAASAGDITGDGNVDLVLEGGHEAVQVILGTPTGLAGATTSWPVDAGAYAQVAALRLSGGTHAWLVVERASESTGFAGAVTVLRGTPAGMAGPATVWSQDSPGIKDAAEPGDMFGAVIAR
jgi:hypothetical protein